MCAFRRRVRKVDTTKHPDGIDKADSGSVTIGKIKIENFNDKQLSV